MSEIGRNDAMIDDATRAKYLKLKAKADAAYQAAKPAEDAAREAMQPYYEVIEEIEELIDGANVTTCEGCSAPIFDGDMCSHDSESGIYFCEACSPTWEDLQREPDGFYRWENDEQVYYTAETAKAAIDAHITDGGSITDKFTLHPY